MVFDFVHFYPTTIHSYRGNYSQLALSYDATGDAPTVEKFIEELKRGLLDEFTGWKGGTFTMDEKTPVWVANSDEAGRTAIVDVIEFDGDVVLKTAKCSF